MQRTLQDFCAVAFCAFGFSLFFLPPGYLFGFFLNVQGFPQRALPEKLLWAVALSTPVSILLAVFLGRHCSFLIARWITIALTTIWFALLFEEQRRGHLTKRAQWDRPVWLATIIAFGLSLYCIVATLGITVGHKLYEGTYAGDWSVRIPLTAAALRSGLPIPTPFYAVDGASAPLRYYYYWYALCGQVGRFTHSTARSVLAASSVWSALALFATLFLFAKYLFPPTQEDSRSYIGRISLRMRCVVLFPISCILGLDVLPAVFGLLMPHFRLYPELEWWRSAGDYSLSFHTAVLYAPHHTAGLVCCMMGFLLLTCCARRSDQAERSWPQVLPYVFAAAICFAAAVGTSTYLTLIFALACVALAVERVLRGDRRMVVLIALTGLIALPLCTTYLGEMLSGAGASLHSSESHLGHARFIALFPRNVGLPRVELIMLGHAFHLRTFPAWLRLLLRSGLTVLLYVTELGFFGFVLAWRVWADFKHRRQLTDVQRMQWALVCALGFAALCLTSQPVIGVNDLGRHAGLALRFVAILWAAPLLLRARYDRAWSLMQSPFIVRAVGVTILLGLSAQLWQAVVQRSYFWLVDRGIVTYPFAPFPRFPHYGVRYYQAREAFEAMDHAVPPSAHVQFNPATTYWTLIGDYLNRPVAAYDLDCQAAFGGDLDKCHAAIPQIRALFGGGHPIVGLSQPFDPAGMTAISFAAVCKQQHLDALIATASDRVWPERASWLWMQPAIFSNASVRIVACPK